MEIGRLAGKPRHETGDGRIVAQWRGFRTETRQFGIAESGMDSPVADRVQRHGFATAPAFRHRMMPFHALAKYA